jgi:phosphoribosylaminoimidazole (AIR) synthetase
LELVLKFLITSRLYNGLKLALGRLFRVRALAHIDGDGLSREIGEDINLVIDDKLSTITPNFTEQDGSAYPKSLRA